jgi:hypothetical protein
MVGLLAKKALDVKITGCLFTGGQTALEIRSAPDRETFVQLRQCAFSETAGPAISCLSGAGRPREPNRSRLLVYDCEFRESGQTLRSNFDQTQLSDCFIQTKLDAGKLPVVDSMGRSMLAENIYGIPQGVASGLGPGHTPRWFDAYGRLLCRNIRFGREHGGIPLAVLKPGERGEVEAYIEDSETWCGADENGKAMIHCEVLPRRVIVRDCIAGPIPLLTVSTTEKLVPKLRSVVHTTANLFPVRLPEEER